MLSFIGDYTCKIDTKGRLVLPASLRKVLLAEGTSMLVVKKNVYEKCLDLFAQSEWEEQIARVKKRLNPYNREHAVLLREFFRGTAEVSMDSNGRLLLPKRLLDSVAITKEVVVAGQGGKMEIWDLDEYNKGALDEEAFMNTTSTILGGENEERDLS